MENSQEAGTEADLKEGKTAGRSRVYFYWGIAAAAAVFFVCFLAFFSWRALHLVAEDNLTMAVARAVGLPAGWVEGRRILYEDFIGDLRAVRKFYGTQEAKISTVEMRQVVWERLIKNKLLEKLAEESKLIVTREEMGKEFENFAKEAGGEKEARGIVERNYGWTVEKFKERILKPFLLQGKLGKEKKIENVDQYLSELLKKSKIKKWARI
ncbi:MAG: SurA N-terminal domain-containing protein [Candidatus Magasanikbacteria bacterium]|nr:SurA N-terminal domain-containing protein [Candidatus Magasanikbacteria bacterium]